MKVLIVADDLTGALDSAVPFASAGMRTVVARRPSDLDAAISTRADVVAVSTASRELSQTDARQAVAATIIALDCMDCTIFKKVDSRLKGHVAAEVSVLAERLHARRVVICPAIPRQGRFVRDGALTGRGVAEPIDVADVLGGLSVTISAPDAESDDDLRSIIAAAGPGDLLVGASGLSQALAHRLAGTSIAKLERPRLVGPVLLAIGSRDPITIRQVEHLRQVRRPAWLGAPNGFTSQATCVSGELAVVQMLPGEPMISGTKASENFSGTVSSLLAGGVRSLVCCGGETVDSVLGCKGAGIIELEGELLSGVPVGKTFFDDKQLQIATKSGGFGEEDCLTSVTESIDF